MSGERPDQPETLGAQFGVALLWSAVPKQTVRLYGPTPPETVAVRFPNSGAFPTAGDGISERLGVSDGAPADGWGAAAEALEVAKDETSRSAVKATTQNVGPETCQSASLRRAGSSSEARSGGLTDGTRAARYPVGPRPSARRGVGGSR